MEETVDTEGTVSKGIAFVRKHFPEAAVGELDPEAARALEDIGRLENPLPQDIIAAFDRHKVGIWGGKVGKKTP